MFGQYFTIPGLIGEIRFLRLSLKSVVIALTVIFSMYILCEGVVTAASQNETHKAFIQHKQQSKALVRELKWAIRTRNRKLINELLVKIQADPQAIEYINKHSSNRFIRRYNKLVSQQKEITISKIRQKVARKYGVHPNNVEVVEFTNPSARPKAGHDWDLTVRIKGKDIPYHEVESIVHESFYEAVGGAKAFPKMTPREVAKTCRINVTSSRHPEAYEGGKKFLKNPAKYVPEDPEQISHAIEYKSHIERNKAYHHHRAGNLAQAEVSKMEQMRQCVKQYEKIVKPTVEANGGKISPRLQKAVRIMKNASSPAMAEAELAKMGETIESVTGKVASNYEATFKLRPSKGQVAGKTSNVAVGKGSTSGSVSSAPKGSFTKRMFDAGAKVVKNTVAAIGILGTAQDIREDLKKGDYSQAGTVAVDTVTGGLYSQVQRARQSQSDYQDAVKNIEHANEWNQYAEEIQAVIALKRHGIGKEEAKKILEDLRRGDTRSFKQAQHKVYKETGVVIGMPYHKHEEYPKPDDTVVDRGKQLVSGMAQGMKHLTEQAAKFPADTTSDIKEIGQSTVDIAANMKNSWQKDSEHNEQLAKLRGRLIDRGADPREVDQAIRQYERNPSLLRDLIRRTAKTETEDVTDIVSDEELRNDLKRLAADTKDIAKFPAQTINQTNEVLGQVVRDIDRRFQRERQKGMVEAQQVALNIEQRRKEKVQQALKQAEQAFEDDSYADISTDYGRKDFEPVKIVVKKTFHETIDNGTKLFTQVAIRFWNVGALIPRYQRAVMLIRSWSRFGEDEPSLCYGTFSGGPNGVLKFPETEDCDAITLKVINGKYLEGEGLRFIVPNPEAFNVLPTVPNAEGSNAQVKIQTRGSH